MIFIEYLKEWFLNAFFDTYLVKTEQLCEVLAWKCPKLQVLQTFKYIFLVEDMKLQGIIKYKVKEYSFFIDGA